MQRIIYSNFLDESYTTHSAASRAMFRFNSDLLRGIVEGASAIHMSVVPLGVEFRVKVEIYG